MRINVCAGTLKWVFLKITKPNRRLTRVHIQDSSLLGDGKLFFSWRVLPRCDVMGQIAMTAGVPV